MPFIFLFLFTSFSFILGDTITLFNTTDQTMYAHFYYQSLWKKNALEAGSFSVIQPKTLEKMQRPPFKVNHDRILVITDKKELLKSQLSNKDIRQLVHRDAGAMQGKSFFVVKSKEKIKLYNSLEWKINATLGTSQEKILWFVTGFTGPVNTWVSKKMLPSFKSSISLLSNEPYRDQTAQVRIGNELLDQERQTTQKRFNDIQTKMKLLFGEIKSVPKIALIVSGGGYRAMFGFLGALISIQKMGLFDLLLWISVLSGSSWMLASYLNYSALQKQFISAANFKNIFMNGIVNKNIFVENMQEADLFSTALLTQVIIKQPMTLVTLWGNLLTNRVLSLFGPKKINLYLSDQTSFVDSGIVPIPIYTAVDGEKENINAEYEWYEFTPWEIGSPWLNCYIPSWAYGRTFNSGISTTFWGTKTLGFQLGTWGSAFATTVEENYDLYKNMLPYDIVRTIVEKTIIRHLGQQRLTWAEVANFSYGITQSPLKNNKTIKLVDAGLAFNIPYPPISGERPERKADIIIALDFSELITKEGVLKGIMDYAHRKKLALPTIDLTNVDQRSISIFKNDDPQTPKIIYIPRLLDDKLREKLKKPEYKSYQIRLQNFDIQRCIDQKVCSYTNFYYTKQQAEQLITFGEFLMEALSEEIFAEIKEVAKR